MKKAIYNFLFVLVLGFLSTQIQAQSVNIESIQSQISLSICGPVEDSLYFTITNDTDSTFTDATAELVFDINPGISQNAVFSDNSTVMYSGMGNLVTLPDLLPGDSVSFYYAIRANCGFMPRSGAITGYDLMVNYKLGADVEATNFLGDNLFNVQRPDVSIPVTNPPFIDAYVGLIDTLRSTVANGGNGALDTFYHCIQPHPNLDILDVKIGNVSLTSIGTIGGLICFRADSAAIAQVYAGGVLPAGMNIIVEEIIEVTSCAFSAPDLRRKASFGCSGTIDCDMKALGQFRSTGITFGTAIARPRIVKKASNKPACYVDSTLFTEYYIINDESNTRGPARDIIITASTSAAVYDLGAYSIVNISTGAVLNNTIEAITTSGGCKGGGVTSFRDTIFGSNLAIGDTILVRTERNHSCDCNNGCQVRNIYQNEMRIRGTVNPCGTASNVNLVASDGPFNSYINGFGQAPLDITGGQTQTVSYTSTSAELDWLSSSYPNAYLEMQFYIPDGFDFAGGSVFFRDFDGTVFPSTFVSYTDNQDVPGSTGDTLVVRFRSIDRPGGFSVTTDMFMSYKIMADCSEKEVPMPCNGTPVYDELIRATGFFVIDPACSSCPKEDVFCPDDLEIRLFCPNAGCAPCEGMVFRSLDISRTNFGDPDADNDQNPNGNFADVDTLVNKKRYLPGDSLRATFQGVVSESSANNWKHGFAKVLFNHIEYTPLGASVFIRDASTGDTYNCSVLPLSIDLSDMSVVANFSIDTLRSLGCVGLPMGFTFADGDSIRVTLDFKSKNILPDAISNVIYDTEFYLSDAGYKMGTIFQCNDRLERLQQVGFYELNDRRFNNFGGCSVPNNGDWFIRYRRYYGSLEGDEFPYEIRPNGIPKEVVFVKPAEFKYRLDLFRVRLINQTLSDENIVNSQLIPSTFLVVSGDTVTFLAESYFASLNQPNSIPPDEGYEFFFYPKVQGSCQSEIGDFTVGYSAKLKVDENVFCTTEEVLPFQSLNGAFDFTGGAELSVVPVINDIRVCSANDSLLVDVKNITAGAATFAFLYVNSPSGNVGITRVEDAATKVAITPNSFGIYQLGTLAGGVSKRYRIFVRTNECDPDVLNFTAGWDCQSYPTTIAEATCNDPSFVNFTVADAGSNLDIFSLATSQVIPLCDTITYEFDVVSTDLGYLRDIFVTSLLPANQEYVVGSYEFAYPSVRLGGTYANTGINPVTVTGGLNFDISSLDPVLDNTGLIGSKDLSDNKVSVRFKTTIQCGYTSGSRVNFLLESSNNCGDSRRPVRKSAARVRVLDVKPRFSADINLSESFINPCDNDTITSRVDLQLIRGSVSNLDSVRFVVPNGMLYVEGTFMPIQNISTMMPIVRNSPTGEQLLIFALDGMVMTGDLVQFSVDLTSRDIGQVCDDYPLQVEVFASQFSLCGDDPNPCIISVLSGSGSANVTISKPVLKLESFSGRLIINPPNEILQLNDVRICNEGANLAEGVPMQFEVYEDVDMSGDRSASDVLLATFDTTLTYDLDFGDCIETNISLPIPSNNACKIIAVFNPDSTCTCTEEPSPVVSPEYVFGYDTEVSGCSATPISLGSVAVTGFDYQWISVEGSDLSLLSSTSSSAVTFMATNNSGSIINFKYALRSSRTSCFSLDTFTVSVFPELGETYTVNACIGSPYSLPVPPFKGNGIVWTPSTGLSFPDASDSTVAVIDNVTANQMYTLTFDSPEGCPVVYNYDVTAVPCGGNSALGDTVFWDINKDGLQTAGEPGIAGVQVNLINASNGSVISTMFTNAAGYYFFNNLPQGNYIVEFIKPTNFNYTIADAMSNGMDAKDSDANATNGRTTATFLGVNTIIPTLDAGFISACSMTSSVSLSSCMNVGGNFVRNATVTVNWQKNPYALAQFGGIDTIVIDFEGQQQKVEINSPNGTISRTFQYTSVTNTNVSATAAFTFDTDCMVTSPMVASPSCEFDLALIKNIVTPQPIFVGDTVLFNVIVENQSTAAKNITVNEYVPAGLRFAPALNPGWTQINSTLFKRIITKTLLTGQRDTLPVRMVVLESLNEMPDYVNRAEISRFRDVNNVIQSDFDKDSKPDDDPNNDRGGMVNSAADNFLDGDGTGMVGDGTAATDEDDSDPAFVNVTQVFDLALYKEIDTLATPAPYMPGDFVSFFIYVVNQGSIPADSIYVTDYVPNGLIFDNAISGPTPTVKGNLVTIDDIGNGSFGISELAIGDTVQIGVEYKIADDFMEPSLTNVAEISYDSNVRDSTDIDSDPDTMEDNDPGGQPDSPADNNIDGNGEGNPGDGIAATDEDDSDPARLSVRQVFDLALIKTVNLDSTPPPYDPGDTVTFAITIFNQGSLSADSITVKDYLPAGLTYIGADEMATSSLGNPIQISELAGNSFGLDTLTIRDTVTFNIQLRIEPTFMGPRLINVAEISFGSNALDSTDVDSEYNDNPNDNRGGAPNSPADNETEGDGTGVVGGSNADTDDDASDPALLNITQVFDLALTKVINTTESIAPYLPGDTITFTVTVYNQGTLSADSVNITDYLPADMTFVSIDEGSVTSASSNAVTVSRINDGLYALDTLAINDNVSFDLRLRINPGFMGTQIVNVAEISNASNALDSMDLDSDADAISNNDPGGQPGSDADDAINGNGEGTIGDGVAATDEDDSDPALVDITQRFDLALTKMINTTASAPPYEAGDTITFSIRVYNQGTLSADSIIVVDHVPAGMIYVDGFDGMATSTNGNSININPLGFGSFGLDTLAINDDVSFDVRLRIDPGFMGGELVNIAEIGLGTNALDSMDIDSEPDMLPNNDAGGQPDSPADNAIDGDGTDTVGGVDPALDEDDSDPARLIVQQVFDLALIKTINTDTTPAPYVPGDTIFYNISVYNQGTLSADSIAVTDYVPMGMTYVSGFDGTVTSEDGNIVTVSELGAGNFGIDTLAAGDTISFGLRLRINPDFMEEQLVNTAEISFSSNALDSTDIDSRPDDMADNDAGGKPESPADDAIGGNGTDTVGGINPVLDEDDSDPALAVITQTFDLALIKTLNTTATPLPFVPGDTIAFTITLYNQGTLSADTLTITDYVPTGLTYLDGSNGNAVSTNGNNIDITELGNGVFGLDTLAAGDTVAIGLRLRINLNFMQPSAVNVAEISQATNVLGIDDTDSDPDNIPDNDAGGNPNTPSDDATDGNGTDTVGGIDPILDEDDSDPAFFPIVQTFDLALTKMLDVIMTPPPYEPGDTVAFIVRVINQGTLNADTLTVTDYIPYGMSYINGDNGGLTTLNGNTIIADEIGNGLFGFDTLQARDSVDFTIRLRIDSLFMGDTLVNVAEISYAENALDSLDIDSDLNNDEADNGGGRPNSDADDATNGNGTGPVGSGDDEVDQDNSDPAFLFVRQVFDLALIKQSDTTVYKQPFIQGDTISFKYTLINQGTLTADTISVIDYIPTGLNFQRATNGIVFSAFGNMTQVTDLGGGEVGIDSLFRGDTLCFEMIFEIDSFFMRTSITNFAEISYAENMLDSMDIDSDPDRIDDNDSGGDPVNDDDKTGEDGKNGGDEDDHDPAFIQVEQQFDLALIKRIDSLMNPGPYFPGDTVPFTITVFNQGRLSADSIQVTDYIPIGLSYVDIPTVTVNSTVRNEPVTISPLVGSPGVYTLDTLPVRDRVSFTIRLRVDESGLVDTVVNYAEISYATNQLDSLDADSRTDNNPNNDAGGAPNTEADNAIIGDGLNGGGMPGDTIALTDEDDHDPALLVITRDKLNAIVLLNGPLGSCKVPTEFMHDSLRSKGLIPLQEPYSAIPGFQHVGELGGTEVIVDSANILSDKGDMSVVDWIFVELRDANNRTVVLNTRSALLLRNGLIVDLDGAGAVCFDTAITMNNDSFYVAVRHRNHLGVMTQNRISLNNTFANPVDFTDINGAFWNDPGFDGVEQYQPFGQNRYALYSGNANVDKMVQASSDILAVQMQQMANPPNTRSLSNFIRMGYLSGDVNMDGSVIFTGQNNDVDLIYNTIYGFPINTLNDRNFVIPEQLPTP